MENPINVRDFIVNNYTPYEGDDSFSFSNTNNYSNYMVDA